MKLQCLACKAHKPSREFYVNRASARGFVARCKDCLRQKRATAVPPPVAHSIPMDKLEWFAEYHRRFTRQDVVETFPLIEGTVVDEHLATLVSRRIVTVHGVRNPRYTFIAPPH